MNIQAISNQPTSFKAKGVNVPRNLGDNSNRKYLYNEVMGIVNKCKLPAVVSNRGVELPSPTKEALDKLTEKGIKFEALG